MSRTYKDVPLNVKLDDNERWPYYDVPSGTITKKKRYSKPNWETFYHSTPGWFTHLYMTIPRRRENRCYEVIIKQVSIKSLDEYEPFLNWNKPHEYYW